MKATIKLFQKGFNFSQDGPGNRLVYHLQGCNMRCPWCSNPEGISLSGHKGVSEVSVDELIDEIKRSSMMFFDGGGVTFTGGEATLQLPVLKEVLTRLKGLGISTALETNGSNPDLPSVFDLIDYLIMDIKHYDNEKHKRVIGTENKNTLRNIALAATDASHLLVRIPLIGGFNSSASDAMCFADTLLPLLTTKCGVEVLRYHEYGKDKWASCGMEYTVHDAFVSDDDYKDFCMILKDKGIKLIRT